MRLVDILSSSYESLRKNYILFSNKFLPEDIKEQISVDIQGVQGENVTAAEDSFNLRCFVSAQTELPLQSLIFPISQSHGGGAVFRLNNNNIVSQSSTVRLSPRRTALYFVYR